MAKESKRIYQLKIDGIIGYHATADDVEKSLKSANGSDIEVTFSSPGGFVIHGVKIFNLFRNYKGHKTAILDNLAASMSSYIPMVFDYVKAYDNTSFMIHNAQIGAGGDHHELRKKADIGERMSRMLAAKYAEKTGKPITEIQKMMDTETWMFGQEIKDAGFADEIIENKSPKAIKDKAEALTNSTIKWEECKAIIDEHEYKNIDQIAAAIVDFTNQNNEIILSVNYDGEIINITQEEYDQATGIDPEAPYPNEHACRVRQPGDFQSGSFRRITRDSRGKKFDIIIGRLKGKTTTSTQAYRYSKDTWSEAEAKSHCNRNKGKTFEPATGCINCGNSTHNNENPAEAGEKKRRFTNMSLKQLLDENPAAKAEYEENLRNERAEGKKEAFATFEAVKPFMMKDTKYPDAIINLGFEALAGKVDLGSFRGAVAAYDATMEANNSSIATTETNENPETPSEPPAQDGTAKTAEDIAAMAKADEVGA